MNDDTRLGAPPLPDAHDDPSLAVLWRAVGAAVQRRGRHSDGILAVRGLDSTSRRALTELLGRPVREPVRIDSSELERGVLDRWSLSVTDILRQVDNFPDALSPRHDPPKQVLPREFLPEEVLPEEDLLPVEPAAAAPAIPESVLENAPGPAPADLSASSGSAGDSSLSSTDEAVEGEDPVAAGAADDARSDGTRPDQAEVVGAEGDRADSVGAESDRAGVFGGEYDAAGLVEVESDRAGVVGGESDQADVGGAAGRADMVEAEGDQAESVTDHVGMGAVLDRDDDEVEPFDLDAEDDGPALDEAELALRSGSSRMPSSLSIQEMKAVLARVQRNLPDAPAVIDISRFSGSEAPLDEDDAAPARPSQDVEPLGEVRTGSDAEPVVAEVAGDAAGAAEPGSSTEAGPATGSRSGSGLDERGGSREEPRPRRSPSRAASAFRPPPAYRPAPVEAKPDEQAGDTPAPAADLPVRAASAFRAPPRYRPSEASPAGDDSATGRPAEVKGFVPAPESGPQTSADGGTPERSAALSSDVDSLEDRPGGFAPQRPASAFRSSPFSRRSRFGADEPRFGELRAEESGSEGGMQPSAGSVSRADGADVPEPRAEADADADAVATAGPAEPVGDDHRSEAPDPSPFAVASPAEAPTQDAQPDSSQQDLEPEPEPVAASASAETATTGSSSSGTTTSGQAPRVVLESVTEWLREHPEANLGPWLDPWLAGVHADPDLTGQLTPEDLDHALAVLSEVCGSDPHPRSRVQLAHDVTGDKTALDDDRALTRTVLRGLAARAGVPAPTTARARRELWITAEVLPDLVSTTCLVLGIAPLTDAERGQGRWWAAAGEGAPVHVTGWDLRSRAGGPWRAWEVTRPVLVCQSPRVIEAIAQRFGGAVPVVCTNGQPGLVAGELLRRLKAADAELRYHGDLDWAGVTLANRMLETLGAVPFGMSAQDYKSALREHLPALNGDPVDAAWDSDLRAVMLEGAAAVPEELLLPDLLAALAED